MATVGWNLRSKRSVGCAISMGPVLPRSAAQRGPFDSRGSRLRWARPSWAACEVGVGGLLGEELEARWWGRCPTPFRCCIKASAEVRGVVDARLAVRQQDRRRDTTRERLPIAVFSARRTPARNTANQAPAVAAHAAHMSRHRWRKSRKSRSSASTDAAPGACGDGSVRCRRSKSLYVRSV